MRSLLLRSFVPFLTILLFACHRHPKTAEVADVRNFAETSISRALLSSKSQCMPGLTNLLDILKDYKETGPFTENGPYSVKKMNGKNSVIYYPEGTPKFALLIWGNGMGATTSMYKELHTKMASYGFIISAVSSSFTSAKDLSASLDNVLQLNTDKSSPLYGRVDADKIGTFGHSYGGGNAINLALSDKRVKSTVGMSAWCPPSKKSMAVPTLLLSGSAENLDAFAQFEALEGDVMAAKLDGAEHLESTGDGNRMRAPTLAWFLATLYENEDAKSYLSGPSCTLCNDAEWEIRSKTSSWVNQTEQSAGGNGGSSVENSETASAVDDGPYVSVGSYAVAKDTKMSLFKGFIVYYPTSAGKYPVVVTGNGMNVGAETEEEKWKHYASYGYVVISSDNHYSDPADYSKGLDLAIQANNQTGHPLFEKLITTKAAAYAYSYGAPRAIEAGILDNRFTAVIASKPALPYNLPRSKFTMAGKLLMVSGTKDIWGTQAIPDLYPKSLGPTYVGWEEGKVHYNDRKELNIKPIATAWLEAFLKGSTPGYDYFFSPSSTFRTDPTWGVEYKGF